MRESKLTRWAVALGALLAAGFGCAGVELKENVRRDIDELMRARQAGYSECYRVALQRDAKLTGTVLVSFNVGAGQLDPTGLQLTSAELTDVALKSCLLEKTQGLKLRIPPHRPLRVSYPIQLTPM